MIYSERPPLHADNAWRLVGYPRILARAYRCATNERERYKMMVLPLEFRGAMSICVCLGKAETVERYDRMYSRLRCAVLRVDVSGDPCLLTRHAIETIYQISTGVIRLAP